MEAVSQVASSNVAIPLADGSLRPAAAGGTSQPPPDVFAFVVRDILERSAPEVNSGMLPALHGNMKPASNRRSVALPLAPAARPGQPATSLATDSVANVNLVINVLSLSAWVPPQPMQLPIAVTPETARNEAPVSGSHSAALSAVVASSASPVERNISANIHSLVQVAAAVAKEALPLPGLIPVAVQRERPKDVQPAQNVQVFAAAAPVGKQDMSKPQIPGLQNTSTTDNPFISILKQVELLQNSAPGTPPAVVAVALTPTAATASTAGAPQAAGIPVLSPYLTASFVTLQPPQLASSSSKDVVAGAAEKAIPEAIHGAQGRAGSRNDSSSAGSGTSADPHGPSPVVDLAKQQTEAFSQVLAATKDAVVQSTNVLQVSHPTTPMLNATDNTPTLALAPGPAKATVSTQPTFTTDVPDLSGSRTVSDAQLTQSTGHSEMRIAMQTDQLGTIELHTRVAGDQLGAAITVEKRDAHAVLAAELPALQQALSEKQLRVDQLSLLQGSLHSTAGDTGAQQHHQERARHAHPAAMQFAAGPLAMISAGGGEQNVVFDSSGRLSVRA